MKIEIKIYEWKTCRKMCRHIKSTRKEWMKISAHMISRRYLYMFRLTRYTHTCVLVLFCIWVDEEESANIVHILYIYIYTHTRRTTKHSPGEIWFGLMAYQPLYVI